MPFDIIPVVGLSQDKLKEIQQYLVRTFRNVHTARGQQIDSNYGRWLDNYNAKPAQDVRSTPWVGASNFVPQLSRMHTDILSARILGIMLGTRPFWRPSTFNSEWKSDRMSALAQYMEMKSNYEISLMPRMDETILEVVKTGTLTMKARWQEEEEWFQVDASTAKPITYQGLELDPVPFYDFYPYPLTAPCIDKTIACFSRLRMTKEEIEYRVAKGIFGRDAADLLLTQGPKVNQQESDAATQAGISLTVDTSRPFTCVEASFKYQLEPGRNMRLIAVFNPFDESAKGLLRLYHSYVSDPKLGSFVDFRIIPRMNSYFGIGVPEILEQAQEEQAQIHNGRRDSNTIANVPTFKKKRYSLNNFSPASEWYPGKTFEVDNMDDVGVLTVGQNYNAMIEEENMILQLSERYTGVSQPMQGMGTGTMGKKGTYNTGGTLALLSEGNRRLDIYIKRLREPIHKLGKIIFTSYRDFGDPAELDQWGQNGKFVKEAFQFAPGSAEYRNMLFDFSASDAGANKETDRQALLLMSNTMAAYYQQIMGLSQAIAGMPDGSPAKAIAMAVLDGANDLATRVLTAFDITDRKTLVPNVRELLGAGSPEQPAQAPNGGGAPANAPNVPDARLQAILGGAAGSPGGQGPEASGGKPQ